MSQAVATYRVEGEALATPPPNPSGVALLSCVSTDPADMGELYLEVMLAGWERATMRVALGGTSPVLTPVKCLRVNRAYHMTGSLEDASPAGTITVRHGADLLATILPDPDKHGSAWDCVYSLTPAMAGRCVLASITPGFTAWHYRGQSPYATEQVLVGDTIASVGTMWAQGQGFCQFEIEDRG